MNMRNICAAVLLATTSFAASAGPDELRPYLNLGYQYVPEDNNRQSGDGQGYWAGGGIPLTNWFTIEGDMFRTDFNRDPAPDNNKWKEYGAQLSGLFTMPIGGGWVPYIAAGAGVTKSRLVGVGDSTDPVYTLGSGVFYLFNAFERDWGLRLDARYRKTDPEDVSVGRGDIEEAVVRFGVAMLFGSSASAAPAPAAPADADGDGVPDASDLCPDTPAGVKVDAKGCPETAEVGSQAEALNSFGPVYFDFDRSDIKASEVPKLDRAVAAAASMERPKIVLKLDGHTDSMGTNEYNQGLGERRAIAVRRYLESKGVKASSIVVTSYGESRPAATNDTDEGRAQNRRVEVFLTED